jgi:hypothetical protein
MASFARRLVTGLALVGVAYALNPERGEQIDRWRRQLRPRLNELQGRYGFALRRMAVASAFVPGLRFRWKVLAAALPQVATALQGTAAGRPGRRWR